MLSVPKYQSVGARCSSQVHVAHHRRPSNSTSQSMGRPQRAWSTAIWCVTYLCMQKMQKSGSKLPSTFCCRSKYSNPLYTNTHITYLYYYGNLYINLLRLCSQASYANKQNRCTRPYPNISVGGWSNPMEYPLSVSHWCVACVPWTFNIKIFSACWLLLVRTNMLFVQQRFSSIVSEHLQFGIGFIPSQHLCGFITECTCIIYQCGKSAFKFISNCEAESCFYFEFVGISFNYYSYFISIFGGQEF